MTNNKLNYRVEQLEKNYRNLDKKISKLLENDLPHMNLIIAEVKTEVNSLKSYIVGATVFNIAAIVFGIMVSRMFL